MVKNACEHAVSKTAHPIWMKSWGMTAIKDHKQKDTTYRRHRSMRTHGFIDPVAVLLVVPSLYIKC